MITLGQAITLFINHDAYRDFLPHRYSLGLLYKETKKIAGPAARQERKLQIAFGTNNH